MVKDHLNVTVEREVLSSIWRYKKETYPHLSKSAMIEILLTEVMKSRVRDLSVIK